MLKWIAFFLFVISLVLYGGLLDWWLYQPYPLGIYALLLIALGLGIWGFTRQRTGWTYGLMALQLSGTVLFFWYTLVLSQVPEQSLAVKVGDTFPSFTLITSQQQPFSPSSLREKSPALYIFYRGDW